MINNTRHSHFILWATNIHSLLTNIPTTIFIIYNSCQYIRVVRRMVGIVWMGIDLT